MLVVLAAVAGAGLFGAAGWLGTQIAERFYGTIPSQADGPPAQVVPQWAFVAIPAAIGAAVATQGASPMRMALLVLAVCALSVCAATDLRCGVIPDAFTLVPLALVLAVSAVAHDASAICGAAIVAVPFAALAAISRGRGMGWGDVKLAALGGALAGMAGITLAVAVAAIVAAMVGVIGGRTRRPIAFGPYLAAAIVATFALGTPG
jgi:leader peptidase (prepilin peptidase)/N-methyltransferase